MTCVGYDEQMEDSSRERRNRACHQGDPRCGGRCKTIGTRGLGLLPRSFALRTMMDGIVIGSLGSGVLRGEYGVV